MTEKEYRAKLKAAGVCTVCHQRTAAPHRTTCEICTEKYNVWRDQRRANWTPADWEKHRADCRNRMNRLHQQRREAGLCIKCGEPVYKGHTLCYEHMLQQRRLMQEYRKNLNIQAHQLPGICRRRGCSEPVVPGKKYCAEHYAAVARAGTQNLKKVDLSVHPFRKDEEACHRLHNQKRKD